MSYILKLYNFRPPLFRSFIKKIYVIYIMPMNTRSKTHKKTIYRHRVKNSSCRKIKRSAACKRTAGCKYASGTKRRYCRKSKNRRV